MRITPLRVAALISVILLPAGLLQGATTAVETAGDPTTDAWSLWTGGDITAADDAARAILETDPRNNRARHLRMLTGSVSGRFQETIAHLLFLDTSYPEYDAARDLVIEAYLHSGRAAEAASLAKIAGWPDARIAWIDRRARAPLRTALEETTIVPFADNSRLGHLMPAVAIEIEGKSYVGHLDTSAAFLLVSPQRAAELDIEHTKTEREDPRDGRSDLSRGLVADLRLGAASLQNVPITVDQSLRNTEMEEMIFIGSRILAEFLTTWDNESHRLLLSPKGDKAQRQEQFEISKVGEEPHPFFVVAGQFLWTSGSIGERDVLFEIDTSPAIVESQGRQPGLVASAATVERRNAEANDRPRRRTAPSIYSPDTVRLGAATLDDVLVQIRGDAHIARQLAGLQPEAQLTHGFLKEFVWTLDFERQQMYLRRIARSANGFSTASQEHE